MNCKPGDLAIVVRGVKGFSEAIGSIVKVNSFHSNNPVLGVLWNIELTRPTKISSYTRSIKPVGTSRVLSECQCADDWLKSLSGETGNEDFVIKARKSLPRKKPVTGPVTIDNRGEVKA